MAEFVRNVLLFGRTLRAAGLPVSPGQSLDFARALELVDLGDRDQVFHAARAFLVNRREELDLFALLFDRFWSAEAALPGADRGLGALTAPGDDPNGSPRVPSDRFLGAGSGEAPGEIKAEIKGEIKAEIEVRDSARTFSDQETLQRKDFSEMSAEELSELRRLILQIRWRASLRRTRRWNADPHGSRLHLRRILKEAARTGGTPLALARRRRKTKRRPIVLLADISGSMENYSRIVLQFFYGALHGFGAGDVECFVFGTRLTRITASLRIRNVDRALQKASEDILDWSGGTRIGASLGDFNRHWARRFLRRGAVVLVVSDGWERGEVAQLGCEMRHLHHRCHRLVWLNPHAGKAGYEPLVEGMNEALPYIDHFLPLHNLRSLAALAEVLAALPGYSGRRNTNQLSNSSQRKTKPATR